MPNRNEYSVEELARGRASDLLVSHASKIHGDLHVLTARVPAGPVVLAHPRRPALTPRPPSRSGTRPYTVWSPGELAVEAMTAWLPSMALAGPNKRRTYRPGVDGR